MFQRISEEEYYTGKQIGEIKVIRKLGNTLIKNDGKVESLWVCKCSCGQIMVEPTSIFLYPNRCNCGCIRRKKRAKQVQDYYKSHPLERLYHVWIDMKKRCYNTSCKTYKYYGGRGITICEEWKTSYQNFRKWAYANGYDENAPRGECTIDRVDNDGNYCPENCRWVSMKEQNRNKRYDSRS